jgi:hypothetical protein
MKDILGGYPNKNVYLAELDEAYGWLAKQNPAFKDLQTMFRKAVKQVGGAASLI